MRWACSPMQNGWRFFRSVPSRIARTEWERPPCKTIAHCSMQCPRLGIRTYRSFHGSDEPSRSLRIQPRELGIEQRHLRRLEYLHQTDDHGAGRTNRGRPCAIAGVHPGAHRRAAQTRHCSRRLLPAPSQPPHLPSASAESVSTARRRAVTWRLVVAEVKNRLLHDVA